MVHFVGAGPGAVDLITVRGLEYIKKSDVIIYAGSLVNPELLNEAKPGCKIYNSAYMNLEEVTGVMKQAHNQGLTTVRLHTGDPSVYGAIREQMDILEKMGIPYDVCPGVSSMFGAAAALKCELTLPEVSQSVIITRAPGRTEVPDRENLRSMASHQATMTLFLSSSLAEEVRDELIAGGYKEDTPVGVVYKATWQEEKVIRTTLFHLPEDMKKAGITKTALIIVGNVLGNTYGKSKLYDAAFTTEYRKGTTVCHDTKETNKIRKYRYNFEGKRFLMLACSEKAYHLMQQVKNSLLSEKEAPEEIICKVKCSALSDLSEKGSLRACVESYFNQVDAVIFFSASGIAVRTIAPFIGHKSKDPAVLAIDEQGKHCISLLAGHMGGANALTSCISEIIGAEPVITTATDGEGRFAVDDFARENNLVLKNWRLAKEISVQLLSGKRVSFSSDLELQGELPEELTADTAEYGIKISHTITDNLNCKCLQLIPKDIVLGIGCRKDTPYENIKLAVEACLEENMIYREAVCAFVSIDLKKDEQGIKQYCNENGIPLVTYSAEKLKQVTGSFTESAFVEKTTGVSNVCERSAVLGAGMLGDGESVEQELLCGKTVYNGVTVALAVRKGCVRI